jgi:hypothetical protein
MVTSTFVAHLIPCILKDKGRLFTGFQTRTQNGSRRKPRAFAAVALVCLILLALLAVAQVAHTHQETNDADHCPLCIVMHSAAPVAAAVALIALVQIAMTTPIIEIRRVTRNWHPQHFTRPPPVAC